MLWKILQFNALLWAKKIVEILPRLNFTKLEKLLHYPGSCSFLPSAIKNVKLIHKMIASNRWRNSKTIYIYIYIYMNVCRVRKNLPRFHLNDHHYIYIWIYVWIAWIKYIYQISFYLLSLYNISILDIEHSPYYIALGSTQNHKMI